MYVMTVAADAAALLVVVKLSSPRIQNFVVTQLDVASDLEFSQVFVYLGIANIVVDTFQF